MFETLTKNAVQYRNSKTDGNSFIVYITKGTVLVIVTFILFKVTFVARILWTKRIWKHFTFTLFFYFVKGCRPVNIVRQYAVPFNAAFWFAFILI